MTTSPAFERGACWRLRSLCWVLVGVCWLRQGSAAPEQEPIRLEYVADEGCPSAAEFERMVFERTHSARPARDEEIARLFSVTLERDARTVRGSLTVRDGDQTLVRQVNGRDCSDLASVLALATALAIDPSAELLPPGATPATADGSGRDGSSGGEPPREREPTPQAEAARRDTPLPYDPPDALPSGSSVELLRLGAGPRVEWAATPYPALGPALSLDFGDEEATWTFGAAASLLFTAPKQVATAQADFRIIAATLNVCSLAFRWQQRVQAGACLQGDFGDIYATSSDIPFGESAHRFWATVGLHLKLVTQLSKDWSLALDVGPNLLLTQYRFEFNEPDTRVFEQGTWAGSTRLMLERAL